MQNFVPYKDYYLASLSFCASHHASIYVNCNLVHCFPLNFIYHKYNVLFDFKDVNIIIWFLSATKITIIAWKKKELRIMHRFYIRFCLIKGEGLFYLLFDFADFTGVRLYHYQHIYWITLCSEVNASYKLYAFQHPFTFLTGLISRTWCMI